MSEEYLSKDRRVLFNLERSGLEILMRPQLPTPEFEPRFASPTN